MEVGLRTDTNRATVPLDRLVRFLRDLKDRGQVHLLSGEECESAEERTDCHLCPDPACGCGEEPQLLRCRVCEFEAEVTDCGHLPKSDVLATRPDLNAVVLCDICSRFLSAYLEDYEPVLWCATGEYESDCQSAASL